MNFLAKMLLADDYLEDADEVVFLTYTRGPFVIHHTPHIVYGDEFVLSSITLLRIGELIREVVRADDYSCATYEIEYTPNSTYTPCDLRGR